ncbi:hypothetical protein [Nocardioides sp. TF02-7]|uniref:hypothetical protein n=1 Tax=Nocardioides sp. TF02-7 TaxID=2917724 RepID=UPI0031F4ECC0
MSNNAYLLRCRHTGEQLLVDAAAEPDTLLPWPVTPGSPRSSPPTSTGTTTEPLSAVVVATGAAVLAGGPDADAITEQTGVEVTRRLDEGDTVAVGDCSPRGHPPHRPHPRLDRPALRRPARRRRTPPLHRRQPLPRRHRQHLRRRRGLPAALRRRRGQGLRPPPRRHLVLPRPRRRLDPRRRAAAPGGVARPGLVKGAGWRAPDSRVRSTGTRCRPSEPQRPFRSSEPAPRRLLLDPDHRGRPETTRH